MDAGKAQRDRLRITLLGGFHICQGDETIGTEHFRLRKARDLVKLLALASDHRLHHEQVMELLWPGNEPEAAANSLHQTLHSARKVLEALHPPCHLRFENEWICLLPEVKLWVDVEEFDQAAQAARLTENPAVILEAIQQYTGELLPEDRYTDIFSQRRESLHQTFLALLKDLARLYEIRSDYPRMIEALKKLVAEEACDEPAHASLMRAYALSGQRQMALRQYQILQETLLQELDAGPCEESRQLYETIRQGELTPSAPLPTVNPPGFTTSPRRLHNLAQPLTHFIGRENEIAQVQALVVNTRLLVLTGAGGVGKTRLALRCAEALLDSFSDGVWLVEFAALEDPGLLPQATASALGLPEDPLKSLVDQLIDFLRQKHLLLIFDNCEHVVGAAANLAEAVLHSCPAVHILATSREILGASGETPFHCPSLSLPAPLPQPSLAELARSEAARLFVDRAWSASPGFMLSETNSEAVTRICQRLDGIPLAIELAAARVRLLTVEQIAARVDNALSLLTGGSRTVLPRHQTLKALIDWSYRLLSPAEQLLLARLSVFSAGWTLEGAEQVCSDQPGDDPQRPLYLPAEGMLDLLGQLLDKSLITTISGRDHSTVREMRYRMLETIRQYAHDRLVEIEGPRIEALHRRHLDYLIRLVWQAEPYLRGEEQIFWLDRLENEHDNLRLAMEWSLKNDVVGGLCLAGPLLWFSHIRHHRAEHIGWLERLLVADTSAPYPLHPQDGGARSYHKARAKVLQTLGFHLMLQHQKDRSISVLEESIFILRSLGPEHRRDLAISLFFLSKQVEDRKLALILESLDFFRATGETFYIAECLLNLGTYYDSLGETRQAKECWEEDLALRREMHDLDGEGITLRYLGELEFHQGHFELARQFYEQSLHCFKQIGNRELVCYVLTAMALLSIAQGYHQEMADYLDRALSIAREIADQGATILALCLTGWLDWYLGNYEQAVARCQEAQILCREINTSTGIESVHYVMGRVALTRSEYQQAQIHLHELLVVAHENKDLWAIVGALEALGNLAVQQGRAEITAHLFGAQHTLVPWLPYTQSLKEHQEHEQALRAAREALGETAFNAAWEKGQTMTLNEAAKEGLSV